MPGRICPRDLEPGDVVFPSDTEANSWVVLERNGELRTTVNLASGEVSTHPRPVNSFFLDHDVLVFRGGEEINSTREGLK